MPAVSLSGLMVVVTIAFLAPLLISLSPARRFPAMVLEILAGIVVGPSVLGWVAMDGSIRILSLIGLAFLLFLAGFEVDLARMKGRSLVYVVAGFLASVGLALLVGYGLSATGQVTSPLLVAIILASTGLGLVVPVLKDEGQATTDFGQLVIAGATIAELGTILLLSLLFSREAVGAVTKSILLVGFGVGTAAFAFAMLRLEHTKRLTAVLLRLQDTTAQIRVRGAFALLVAFVAMAAALGLEVILGAFMAGVVLRSVDRDRALTHPQFQHKLEAVGFGIFTPVFFVASGIQFDLAALVASPATIVRVPIFVLALLAVRGLPALLYWRVMSCRELVSAGLLQATSLSFIVAASAIGLDLGLLTRANGAALISAGLVSVVAFPALAGSVLRSSSTATIAVRA